MPPQRQRISLVNALPEEIVLAVFQHIPAVSSRLKLGACSRALAEVVTHASLWTRISFTVPYCANLTDDALRALLTRVNARQVCVCLSLRGCRRLQGSGLEPLLGSRAVR